MRVVEVIDTLKLGENTLIAVSDSCEDITNGSEILDEYGKHHVILSIGMNNTKGDMKITNILIGGDFNSTKVFI